MQITPPKLVAALLIACCAFAGTVGTALGAHGSRGPDPGRYGRDGAVYQHIARSTSFARLALTSGDRVVTAGSFRSRTKDLLAVSRFTRTGARDKSFSGDGTAYVATRAGEVVSVLVAADDSVTMVAVTRSGRRRQAFVARLTAAGRLDPSFGGGDGLVALTLQRRRTLATDAVLEPDGKLTLAVTTESGSGDTRDSDAWLVRLGADGALDATFDTDGLLQLVEADAGTISASAGVERQADGRYVVVTGVADDPDDSMRTRVTRLQASGAADMTYGAEGTVQLSILTRATDTALDATGKLLIVAPVAGECRQFVDRLRVVRLTTSGDLDQRFGDGGSSTRCALPGETSFRLAAWGSRVLVSGTGSANALSVLRLTSRGKLDTRFGVKGRANLRPSGCCVAGAGVAVGATHLYLAGEYAPDARHTDGLLWKQTLRGRVR